jgi:hypothetical protein
VPVPVAPGALKLRGGTAARGGICTTAATWGPGALASEHWHWPGPGTNAHRRQVCRIIMLLPVAFRFPQCLSSPSGAYDPTRSTGPRPCQCQWGAQLLTTFKLTASAPPEADVSNPCPGPGRARTRAPNLKVTHGLTGAAALNNGNEVHWQCYWRLPQCTSLLS